MVVILNVSNDVLVETPTFPPRFFSPALTKLAEWGGTMMRQIKTQKQILGIQPALKNIYET
jgi:hypothetical protein